MAHIPSPTDPAEGEQSTLLLRAGAIILLLVIFGVPAVLVPLSMKDVPRRSETKILTSFQMAVDMVRATMERQEDHSRRHLPLPDNSRKWIELVNPMGRKAPGGGLAFLPSPDSRTGAIGLSGSTTAVTITLPAYRELKAFSTTIHRVPPPGEPPGQP